MSLHFKLSQLKVPEDSRNRILLYYQRTSPRGTASVVRNVVINVRITEGLRLEDVQRAQNDCYEDLKAFCMLFGSYMKEHHMVLYGVAAAPYVSCEEVLVANFACQLCLRKKILGKEELSGDLKSWWKDIGQEIDKVASSSKCSEDDLFYDVSSEIMAVMSATSNVLPQLYGSDHEKIVTLLLNYSQLEAIKSMEKKKIIRGGFGTGKSVVGKVIVKELYSLAKTGTLIYYICFDKWCLLDYYMLKEVAMMKKESSSNAEVYCCNIIEIIENEGFNKVPPISTLLKLLREKNKDKLVHFVIDEIDGEQFTSDEAESLSSLFDDTLKDSVVVLIIQSMISNFKFVDGNSPKGHCFQDIPAQMKFKLDRLMHNTVRIDKVLAVVQRLATIAPNAYTTGIPRMQLDDVPEDTDLSLCCGDRVLAQHGWIRNTPIQVKVDCVTAARYPSIPGGIPNVWFLDRLYDTRNMMFFAKVLAAFLKHDERVKSKPRVVICNDLEGCRLLERVFLILGLKWVAHVPQLYEELPEWVKRKHVMKCLDKQHVLLTDCAGFRGMEEENVLVVLEKNEYYYRHSLPEIVCRATPKLNFIVYEKESDATTRSDSSIGKFFDELVNDQLAKKYDICIKDETPSGESMVLSDGTSYNIYTQTTKFKELDTNTYMPKFQHLPNTLQQKV